MWEEAQTDEVILCTETGSVWPPEYVQKLTHQVKQTWVKLSESHSEIHNEQRETTATQMSSNIYLYANADTIQQTKLNMQISEAD